MNPYQLTSTLFTVSVFLFVSCSTEQNKKEEKIDTIQKITKIEKSDSLVEVPADTISLQFLLENAGDYPHDIKLFEKPQLKERLKKLLGQRYQFFMETWAVESPIEINKNNAIIAACEAHNCDATNFIVVADMEKEILFAGIREVGKVQVFSEKSNIKNEELEKWADKK